MIDSTKEEKNAFDSIRVSSESLSNETDKRVSQQEKHDEPRI
jgi:hypothetical protein